MNCAVVKLNSLTYPYRPGAQNQNLLSVGWHQLTLSIVRGIVVGSLGSKLGCTCVHHLVGGNDSQGDTHISYLLPALANDAGNLDDIREFTSPEMFAEIKMAISERNGAEQETDVAQLDAQVIDVVEEANRYIVSVHFSGQIREERNGPVENFSEIWHMMKPTDGSRGWVIAGIQQVQ